MSLPATGVPDGEWMVDVRPESIGPGPEKLIGTSALAANSGAAYSATINVPAAHFAAFRYHVLDEDVGHTYINRASRLNGRVERSDRNDAEESTAFGTAPYSTKPGSSTTKLHE